jgi:prepilin-type N-terminal cleavage/methylation domain-containing protein
MNVHTAHHRAPRGFTLVELLIVISIMAILAGILIPSITVVRQQAKIAGAQSLIKRLEAAIVSFESDHGYYPPDAVETGTALYDPVQPDLSSLATTPITADQVPPQALYYYVTNGFVGENAPYTTIARGAEAYFFDEVFTQRLPAIVDPWGRPFLYNRKPRGTTGNFKTDSGVKIKPRHNPDSFDLFSVGPDGQTGANDLPKNPFETQVTLRTYCLRALDNDNDGNADDDICNWKNTN